MKHQISLRNHVQVFQRKGMEYNLPVWYWKVWIKKWILIHRENQEFWYKENNLHLVTRSSMKSWISALGDWFIPRHKSVHWSHLTNQIVLSFPRTIIPFPLYSLFTEFWYSTIAWGILWIDSIFLLSFFFFWFQSPHLNFTVLYINTRWTYILDHD